MDVNSILSSYMSGIYTNYDVTKVGDTTTESSNSAISETDSYIPSESGYVMDSGCYDYSSMVLGKSVNAANSSEAVSETEGSKETGSASGGGSSGDDSESETETEVKIINGQAYMIITTTDEEGNTTVRNIKMGGTTAKGNEDDKFETTDLADAVTM